ncbi:MAG: 23S rRNA pseudouridine2605 synthase [Candidatus Latescibacterota bacterium]|jgi:23S rRNA pseudouridine2605 synthase
MSAENITESMRLNRFLARSGVASRRKSDDLIASGIVRVNGEVVDQLGSSVDPRKDRVECGGQLVQLPSHCEYLMLNKPAGYVVTCSDTHGRPTVFDLVSGQRSGTMPVGRLDMDTTGLLLLTDDGDLAYRLLHPSFVIDKLYEAVVRGTPDEMKLDLLREGIELDDGPTAPARVEVLESGGSGPYEQTRIRLCIHEGRKRQVRRMLRAIGHPVRALKRVAFAGLVLDGIEEGQHRFLSTDESCALHAQVGL